MNTKTQVCKKEKIGEPIQVRGFRTQVSKLTNLETKKCSFFVSLEYNYTGDRWVFWWSKGPFETLEVAQKAACDWLI